uniref:V-type proton ATPase subunit a n=1 Tax=Glossina pallidipes TaxID=7398 RepID=A0A1B0AGZ5_GLOPL
MESSLLRQTIQVSTKRRRDDKYVPDKYVPMKKRDAQKAQKMFLFYLHHYWVLCSFCVRKPYNAGRFEIDLETVTAKKFISVFPCCRIMSFFRSEPMSLCQILLHSESAFNCLVELGYLGVVQFRNIYDETAVPNNLYNVEIQRCHDLQRIIAHLQDEIEDFKINVMFYPDVDEDEVPKAIDLRDMETQLLEVYDELTDVERNCESLRRTRNHLYEHMKVIIKADEFLTGERNTEPVMAWTSSIIMDLVHDEMKSKAQPQDKFQLSFFTGTIPPLRFTAFETMVWRITRGNYFIKHEEITFPQEAGRKSSQLVRKYVFMLYFLGSSIREKLTKVCQGFGIKLFECPEGTADRRLALQNIDQDIKYLDRILEQTENHRFRILLIAGVDVYIWKIKLKKMLMVYYVLNRMKRVRHLQKSKYLQAECWIPTAEVGKVRRALMRGAQQSAKDSQDNMFPPMVTEMRKKYLRDEDKPTHFRLNRFTRGFQNLIDAYGIAAYRELNPAPYTIITFPFLFAVMFGDVGHGVIMASFGFWMVIKEKRLIEQNRRDPNPSEIWTIMFAGRYIIALMGLDPARPDNYLGDPYYFGMDPVWDISGEHAITTFNSLKMKLAIILGVTQMMFGLILSAWDNYGGHIAAPYNSACAPSILITFINMLLLKSNEVPPECNDWMFSGQDVVQIVLLVFALTSIPILLAGRPLYVIMQKKRIIRAKSAALRRSRTRSTLTTARRTLVYNVELSQSRLSMGGKKEKEDPTEDITELWIHSGIHCIESVLGSVSHTASYLRLWALSLAHDQLSSVLWNMVLKIGLAGGRGYLDSVIIYGLFAFWAILTLAILVIMEGLSAFLHTLRLHWVEFQSKFYAGSGEAFMPFKFPPSTMSVDTFRDRLEHPTLDFLLSTRTG